MTSLSEYDIEKLNDFITRISNGNDIILSLARSIFPKTSSLEESFKIVTLNHSNLRSILNRKIVTKEILFEYLTKSQQSLNFPNPTKMDLVEQIIDYWTIPEHKTSQTRSNEEEHYPINVMSREFSAWFFDNWNKSTLQQNDFWPDCKILLSLSDNTNETYKNIQGSSDACTELHNLRLKFNLLFNPNNCHEGIQGRIESHGIAAVLCCGTIHTPDNCVGLFEAVFFLNRDPFCGNNWKIKNMKIEIKSKIGITCPQLIDCESLQELVLLPQNDKPLT